MKVNKSLGMGKDLICRMEARGNELGVLSGSRTILAEFYEPLERLVEQLETEQGIAPKALFSPVPVFEKETAEQVAAVLNTYTEAPEVGSATPSVLETWGSADPTEVILANELREVLFGGCGVLEPVAGPTGKTFVSVDGPHEYFTPLTLILVEWHALCEQIVLDAIATETVSSRSMSAATIMSRGVIEEVLQRSDPERLLSEGSLSCVLPKVRGLVVFVEVISGDDAESEETDSLQYFVRSVVGIIPEEIWHIAGTASVDLMAPGADLQSCLRSAVDKYRDFLKGIEGGAEGV